VVITRKLAAKFILIALVIFTAAVIAHAATYVGSRHSNKYHYPNCRYALKIKQENVITFSSAQEAIAAGYVPCKVCKPPVRD
jgi:methylphosphotriester-DNA--protein-cysteine methyltransferase